MTQKTKVELPKATLDEREPKGPPVPPITLAVLENGSIFWNDEPVTKGLLESKLSVEAQKTPQPAINVRGDRTTKYRIVSEIVNIAQAQGMRKVGFVAEPELTR
jgi:biopolymer transport protein ExbD